MGLLQDRATKRYHWYRWYREANSRERNVYFLQLQKDNGFPTDGLTILFFFEGRGYEDSFKKFKKGCEKFSENFGGKKIFHKEL